MSQGVGFKCSPPHPSSPPPHDVVKDLPFRAESQGVVVNTCLPKTAWPPTYVSFVKTADNYLELKIKENLNKKIGNNLFNSIEAFDYTKNTFYNIDDVLKDFNIFENKELINHNPSNNNGIFYVVATIPK